MSHENRTVSSIDAHKTRKQSDNLGYCLNCGQRLTHCGLPFTLDVTCNHCNSVNVYIDSVKPKYIKEIEAS